MLNAKKSRHCLFRDTLKAKLYDNPTHTNVKKLNDCLTAVHTTQAQLGKTGLARTKIYHLDFLGSWPTKVVSSFPLPEIITHIVVFQRFQLDISFQQNEEKNKLPEAKVMEII